MAEWLRRVIRNHLGSSRAGSNPVQCELLLHKMNLVQLFLNAFIQVKSIIVFVYEPETSCCRNPVITG